MVNTDTIRSDSSPCKKSASSDSVTIASPGTTWPRTAPISCPASAVQLFSSGKSFRLAASSHAWGKTPTSSDGDITITTAAAVSSKTRIHRTSFKADNSPFFSSFNYRRRAQLCQ